MTNQAKKILSAVETSARLRGAHVSIVATCGGTVHLEFCCIGHADSMADTMKKCSMHVEQDGIYLSIRYSTKQELSKMQ